MTTSSWSPGAPSLPVFCWPAAVFPKALQREDLSGEPFPIQVGVSDRKAGSLSTTTRVARRGSSDPYCIVASPVLGQVATWTGGRLFAHGRACSSCEARLNRMFDLYEMNFHQYVSRLSEVNGSSRLTALREFFVPCSR